VCACMPVSRCVQLLYLDLRLLKRIFLVRFLEDLKAKMQLFSFTFTFTPLAFIILFKLELFKSLRSVRVSIKYFILIYVFSKVTLK